LTGTKTCVYSSLAVKEQSTTIPHSELCANKYRGRPYRQHGDKRISETTVSKNHATDRLNIMFVVMPSGFTPEANSLTPG